MHLDRHATARTYYSTLAVMEIKPLFVFLYKRTAVIIEPCRMVRGAPEPAVTTSWELKLIPTVTECLWILGNSRTESNEESGRARSRCLDGRMMALGNISPNKETTLILST